MSRGRKGGRAKEDSYAKLEKGREKLKERKRGTGIQDSMPFTQQIFTRPTRSTRPGSGGSGITILSTLEARREQKACETLQSSVTMCSNGPRAQRPC